MLLRLAIFLVLFLLSSCNLEQRPATIEAPTAPPTLDAPSCDQIINSAIAVTNNTCGDLSRNQACYGHSRVSIESATEIPISFDAPGDRSPLTALRSLRTSPLNEANREWGVALLAAQADLPDTLPGQNVIFVVFGEAAIDGLTSDLQAVTLSTGLGQPACAAAPQAAILVQSPAGATTRMRFNGASVELGSTVHITAHSSGQFTLATLEGQASISAFNQTQIVLPGSQVRLPLGGADGLQAIGPPSPPEPYDLNTIQRAPIVLLPNPIQLPQPRAPQAAPTATPIPNAPVSTAQPPACVPRADWQTTYSVQPRDTLFSIAQRYNLSLAELQSANCIADPNVISVGQVLRVPFVIQATRPTPTPTTSPTPTQGRSIPPTNTETLIPPPSDTPDRQNQLPSR